MDYKELICKLRQKDGCNCECLEAATAIETLLAERDKAQEQLLDIQATLDMYGGEYGITAAFQKAEERDAAVEDLHGACRACVYAGCFDGAQPCAECTYGTGIMWDADNWQWRGPKKGDAK